jgi:hypothetical protein
LPAAADRRPVAFLVAAFAAATLATNVARAQLVRGTVADSTTGQPIPAAVVMLTDSAGVLVARSITAADGRFSLSHLPRTRRARIVRIGYRPIEVPLDTADSVLRVRMTPIPSLLATVSSSRTRVCSDERDGPAALALWEQVRAALLASLVAREQDPPRLHLQTYQRTHEAITRRLLDDTVRVEDVVAARSFVSARPAWAFELHGYMNVNEVGDRDYYGPDETVLLDSSFAAMHCLRVVRADDKHEDQIGLGFDPIDDEARDTLVDISGVLWIDRARDALRALEFRYTNLEPAIRDAGGEIQFVTLPTGAPMIASWTIHAPTIAVDVPGTANGVYHRPLPRARRVNIRILGDRIFGGEVASAEWADGTRWHGDVPRIVGTVVDMAGQPVVGARVWLRDGTDTLRTAADGTFQFPYDFPGAYVVLASDSALAAEGLARSAPVRVLVVAAADYDVTLVLHPRSEVFQLICPPNAYHPGTGVVMARVVDENNAAIARPVVAIETSQLIVAGDTITRIVRREGQGGDDGRFVVCGASLDRPMAIRASKDQRSATRLIRQLTGDLTSVTVVLRPVSP